MFLTLGFLLLFTLLNGLTLKWFSRVNQRNKVFRSNLNVLKFEKNDVVTQPKILIEYSINQDCAVWDGKDFVLVSRQQFTMVYNQYMLGHYKVSERDDPVRITHDDSCAISFLWGIVTIFISEMCSYEVGFVLLLFELCYLVEAEQKYNEEKLSEKLFVPSNSEHIKNNLPCDTLRGFYNISQCAFRTPKLPIELQDKVKIVPDSAKPKVYLGFMCHKRCHYYTDKNDFPFYYELLEDYHNTEYDLLVGYMSSDIKRIYEETDLICQIGKLDKMLMFCSTIVAQFHFQVKDDKSLLIDIERIFRKKSFLCNSNVNYPNSKWKVYCNALDAFMRSKKMTRLKGLCRSIDYNRVLKMFKDAELAFNDYTKEIKQKPILLIEDCKDEMIDNLREYKGEKIKLVTTSGVKIDKELDLYSNLFYNTRQLNCKIVADNNYLNGFNYLSKIKIPKNDYSITVRLEGKVYQSKNQMKKDKTPVKVSLETNFDKRSINYIENHFYSTIRTYQSLTGVKQTPSFRNLCHSYLDYMKSIYSKVDLAILCNCELYKISNKIQNNYKKNKIKKYKRSIMIRALLNYKYKIFILVYIILRLKPLDDLVNLISLKHNFMRRYSNDKILRKFFLIKYNQFLSEYNKRLKTLEDLREFCFE